MFWWDEIKLAILVMHRREEHTMSSGADILIKSTHIGDKLEAYGSGPNTGAPTVESVCERRGTREFVILATVVSPAPVAIKSHITPLRTENALKDWNYHNQKWSSSHLLPEETRKAKHAPSAITQTVQTKKHCKKQQDVGNKHGDDGKFIALYVGQCAALITK
jgi:hypothetical protein